MPVSVKTGDQAVLFKQHSWSSGIDWKPHPSGLVPRFSAGHSPRRLGSWLVAAPSTSISEGKRGRSAPAV